MKKLIRVSAIAIAMSAPVALAQEIPQGYQLQQVLIMSRHNLRAPLANNGSVLEQSTPNRWPQWDVPGGELTTKGGVLEVYMGHFMREWLVKEQLLKAGECPSANSVYVWANTCNARLPRRSSSPTAHFLAVMFRFIIRKKWAPWIPLLIR